MEPFRPSTVFAADFRPGALTGGKQRLAINRSRFRTPYLRIGDPQVFFGRSAPAAGTAERRASLVFNHPVRPAGVRGRLKVSRNDKPLSLNIISTNHD